MAKSEREQLLDMAVMQGAPVSGPGRMYVSIPKAALSKGPLPDYSFSDIATRKVYEPVPSMVKLRHNAPKFTIQTPLREMFDVSPRINRMVGSVPIDMNDIIFDLYNMEPDTRGFFAHNTASIGLRPIQSAEDKARVAAHEMQHAISFGQRAQPIVRKNPALDDFLNYYTNPEEVLARKAMDAIHIDNPADLTKHFNAPDPYVPYHDMKLGYSPAYSQQNVINFSKGKMANWYPKRVTISDLKRKKFDMKDVSDIGKRISRGAQKIENSLPKSIARQIRGMGMLTAISSILNAKGAYDSMNRAKKAGASPLGALINQSLITPTAERLPGGKIYNYQTGEVTDDMI